MGTVESLDRLGEVLWIRAGNCAIPPGHFPPREVIVRRGAVRERGAFLGWRYFLQAWGDVAPGEVAVVYPEEIAGSRGTCEEFLAAYGFRTSDEVSGIYSR